MSAIGFEAAWWRLRQLAGSLGFGVGEREIEGGGRRMVLTPGEGSEDVYFAVVPPTGEYVSLALVLVVDLGFFREEHERILEVTSRFEVCAWLARDAALPEGEAYLNLCLRIFTEGLNALVLGAATENLRAARLALARSFP